MQVFDEFVYDSDKAKADAGYLNSTHPFVQLIRSAMAWENTTWEDIQTVLDQAKGDGVSRFVCFFEIHIFLFILVHTFWFVRREREWVC